jgi:cytochrome b subunit of formate dehydrogenase
MADLVHGRANLTAGRLSRPATTQTASSQSDLAPLERQDKPPRTDVGTLTLHWATAIAFIISLFTGVRIAADALNAPVSHWLNPILPQGEIWTWHFLAGLALFFCGSAYLIYMKRSGLANRNALKKTRVLVMPVASRMRFGGLNVLLHWAAYLIIVIMTVTGIFLYLGHGGWLISVHSYTAFVGLAYVFVHAVAHYLYGGWWQVFRVFRPAKLVLTAAVKPRPLLIAAAIGLAVTAAIVATDWGTRDTLIITKVDAEPKLDGVLDEALWSKAWPVTIRTQQGENFGGPGESTVEVRAVQNGQKVFFAFKWTDPTRSLRRIPMIKKEDGWHVLDSRAGRMDVVGFYEDKLAIIFSDKPSIGGAGVSNLGPSPLPADKPRPLNERGFHFTTDGSYVDMWQWKASRGGMLGRVDDQYIGPPRDVSADEAAYKARYQGGYWNDPGRAYYSYNYKFFPKDHKGPVEVLRLPKDWKKTQDNLGKFNLNPNSGDDENGLWNININDTDPYTKEADARIPVGTVMPGVLISGNYEGDRGDLIGGSRWKDGYWTLEVARALKTGSKFDKDFVPGKDVYMWVAVFDHVQTRHSRHPRPVRIVTQE